jgi:plasmid maintenance system antidote protein VapI
MYSGSNSLPILVRSEQNSPRTDVDFSNKRQHGTAFDKTVDELMNVEFPAIDNGISVKDRICQLESTCVSQTESNTIVFNTFHNLSNNLHTTDSNLRDIIQHVKSITDATIAALKKEYDHKFELQSSENKRLQNTVASLKAESNQTKRKLQKTAESLKKLKAEFGDAEDDPSADDFETMSIMSAAFSTRPNTTL